MRLQRRSRQLSVIIARSSRTRASRCGPPARKNQGSDLATHQGGLQHKGSPRPRLISLLPQTHTHSLSRSRSLRALAGAGRQTSDWGDSVSSHKRLKAEGSKSVMCQSSGSRGAPRRPALAGGALEGEAGAPLTARYSRSAGGCVRRGLFRIMAFAFKVRLRRLCTSNLVVDHPRGQTRAGATGGSDLATHQGGLQHKGSPRPRLISLPPHTLTLSLAHIR